MISKYSQNGGGIPKLNKLSSNEWKNTKERVRKKIESIAKELLELYEEAEDILDDDFNEKDFHEFFLSVGPTYYEIIRERMIMWINEQ